MRTTLDPLSPAPLRTLFAKLFHKLSEAGVIKEYEYWKGQLVILIDGVEHFCSTNIQRWSIEKWWRWLKRIYKVKEPLGESENALPLQIVAAFVTDLALRAFNHCGGFKGTLYDFVKTCREIALIPISGVIGRMRQALVAAAVSLKLLEALSQEQT